MKWFSIIMTAELPMLIVCNAIVAYNDDKASHSLNCASRSTNVSVSSPKYNAVL